MSIWGNGSISPTSAASHQYLSHCTINDIHGNQINIADCHHEHERRVIADWLSSLNFKAKQSDIFEKRTDETGKWLLETHEFKTWLAGTSDILWCSGMPGAGKTVLASTVVDCIQTSVHENVAIACVYCDYKQQIRQTVPELIASLLKQLVQDHPATSENIKSLYHRHIDANTRPSHNELTDALQSEIGTYSKVFIVVDALDECLESNQGSFISFLKHLTATSAVNLMVTSRPLPSIGQHFQDAKCLDIYANNEDIRTYIRCRIPRSPRLARHVDADPTLEESIVNKIVANVRGMFLLAQLHMDSLVTKSTRREVRNALEKLPAEVNSTYNEAMDRIAGQGQEDRKLAKQVLSWITHACRPLSLKELQHALAVTSPEMTDMDPEAIVDELTLTFACAGLVVIDGNSNIIRLVHYTAQVYFENNRDSLFPNVQAEIGGACLTYLSFNLFGTGYCRNNSELESLLEGNPLLKYAASHWGHHVHGQAEEICREMVLKFLAKKFNIACASQVLLTDGQYDKLNEYSQDFPENFFEMHLLSFFGLEKTISYLLENGARADPRDSIGRSPLLLAAEKGHDEVVRLLVAREDVNVNSVGGSSPLLLAAKHGHAAVVRLLMARPDIKPNLEHSLHGSSLSLASANGHEAVVELLVAREIVEVNSKDRYGRSPLSLAAKNGHIAVVKLLMGRDDIDINLKDSFAGRSPLSFAAENGHEAVVQQLLTRNDVEVNSEDKYGHSPLSLAANNGHDAVVKLLLARDDIEVNSKDTHGGRSPLSPAAEYGHEMVVKLLVAREDIEVNSKSVNGRAPLWFAAGNGHEAVVRSLLAQDDIEVDSKDRFGRSPLWKAAEKGHSAVVKLLLARPDVEVNSKDDDGRSPLSYAARHGHEAVVKLLMARDDIEVDSKDRYGRSPLSFAAEHGHAMVVRLLLERDNVEVDSKDSFDGRSPLSFAAANGHDAVVSLLLMRDDVEVDSKDSFDCRTPLSFAAEFGHEVVVKLLLDRGIEVDSKDSFDGRTPLSFAAGSGHEAVVRLLVARDDVEVESSDIHGQTPLRHARRKGHEGVVEILNSKVSLIY